MTTDERPAIVGIEKCGCVTYANSDPDHLDKQDHAAHARIINNGGQVLRTTVAAVRTMANFLPAECPHNPKGWTRGTPKAVNRIRYRRTHRGTIRRVAIIVPGWATGLGAGEVVKRGSRWYATTGWFDSATGPAGAHHGDEPCDELGPYPSMRAAAESLIPSAEARGKQLRAEIEAGRKKAAA